MVFDKYLFHKTALGMNFLKRIIANAKCSNNFAAGCTQLIAKKHRAFLTLAARKSCELIGKRDKFEVKKSRFFAKKEVVLLGNQSQEMLGFSDLCRIK